MHRYPGRRRPEAGGSLPGVPRLLFVHHTVSPALHDCYLAALQGATDPSVSGDVEVVSRAALEASASDMLAADAYLLGSPVMLGYLSGALKHFFDGVYYPCLEQTRGRSFGAYLHGSGDVGGGRRALESISTGLGWRPAQAIVEVIGPPGAVDRAACRELGAAIAAGLLL